MKSIKKSLNYLCWLISLPIFLVFDLSVFLIGFISYLFYKPLGVCLVELSKALFSYYLLTDLSLDYYENENNDNTLRNRIKKMWGI